MVTAAIAERGGARRVLDAAAIVAALRARAGVR
jgi:hypothetical protein